MALIVIILLAGFGWFFWLALRTEPPTHFIALTTGPVDFLSVPPILFEEETLAPLKQLETAGSTFRYVPGESAHRRGRIDDVKALLDGQDIKPKDRLIVYVSAHGVSDDGVPYVLGPGYEISSPESDRYSAISLINMVKDIDAATKLIVFDCSRLAFHTRMGMALNEFSSLVEQAANEINDPNLWIMTAAKQLQTSPLGLAERRSPLGHAIVEALSGAADQNEDRDLTVTEFDSFVRKQCALSAVATPEPQLFAGAASTTNRNADKQLVLRIPQVTPDEDDAEELAANDEKEQTADDDVASDKAASQEADQTGSAQNNENSASNTSEEEADAERDEGEPNGDGNSAASDDSTTEPGEGDEAGDNATDSTPTPNSKAETSPAFPMAWQERDQLHFDPGRHGPDVLPVDCAPHLWNLLNAVLVTRRLELMGAPPDAVSQRAEIERELAAIKRSLAGLNDSQSNPSGDAALLRQLSEAVAAYHRSQEFASFKSGGIPEDLARAVLDFRRYTYRANQYIQWHAAEVGALGSASTGGQEINELLTSLQELDVRLARLAATELQSWNEDFVSDVVDQANQVRYQAAAVNRLIANAAATIASSDDPVSFRRAECLLSTSLASAQQRENLQTSLDNKPRKTKRQGSGSEDISALIDHLKLEARLLQLVDPTVAASETFNSLLESSASSGPNTEATRQHLRKIGAELAAAYTALPGKISQRVSNGSTREDRRVAGKMLTAVHYWDASVAVEFSSNAGFVAARLTPPSMLAIRQPSLATLRTDEFTELVWTISRQNITINSATVELDDFDSRALELRFTNEEQAARPGDIHKLTRAELDEFRISVRAIGNRTGSPEARTQTIGLRFNLNTDAGFRPERTKARVRLPLPNRIELFAYCVDPEVRQIARSDSGVLLQTFPNRTTDFRLQIANHTENLKNLRVELIAVPTPETSSTAYPPGQKAWPRGRLFDREDQPIPELVAWLDKGAPGANIVGVAEIELPADKRPRDLAFKSPTSAPAEANNEEENAAGEATPPPSEAAVVDVSYGFICRITNPERPQEMLYKWIEIAPRRPSNYIDIRGEYVQQGSRRREIRFMAEPVDLDRDGRPDFPPGAAEKPVTITAIGKGRVLLAGKVVEAILAPGASRAEMIIRVEEDLDEALGQIDLHVDGYPRADIWNVDFEDKQLDRVRDLESLEIGSIGMVGSESVPARLYAALPSLADEKTWPERIRFEPEGLCAFAVPKRARDIQLQLKIDAPFDAFNVVGGGDEITVRWEGIDEDDVRTKRLFGDRDVRTELTAINDEGHILLSTAVSDHVLQLKSFSANDRVRRLMSRMTIAGNPRLRARTTVAFDDRPPRLIDASISPSKIDVGALSQFKLSLDVDDLSAISQLDVWVLPVAERPQTETELDPAKTTMTLNEPVEYNEERTYSKTVLMPVPEKAGAYIVFVRVTDGSGQFSSNFRARRPLVLQVVDPPPIVEGPIVADLEGKVVFKNGNPVRGLKIAAKKNGKYSAKTDNGGNFKIPGVKEGTYTLVIQGTVGSGNVDTEYEVALEERPNWKDIEITVELQLSKPPE